MIFKHINYLLIFLFVKQTFQIPECRILYYYFCEFDGETLPPQAVAGYIDKKGMAFPTPYGDDEWYHVPDADESNDRVLCSNDKSAFQWKHHVQTEVDLSEHLRDIDVQRTIVVDGKTTKRFLRMKNKKRNERVFLQINCLLNEKEPGPKLLRSPIFQWENYNLEVPQNAFEAGIDSPQSNISFYIGLTTFAAKTYVVKIIPKTTWFLVVTSSTNAYYITAARETRILCINNGINLVWKKVVTESEESSALFSKIYKCKRDNEYVLSGNVYDCAGFPTEKLVYAEDASYFTIMK